MAVLWERTLDASVEAQVPRHPSSESSAHWDVSVPFAEVGDHASKRRLAGWGR